MISLRGPKLKIFAGILAAICLGVGIYLTFFHSKGFLKTTGTIVELRADTTDGSTVYFPTVEYSVAGKTYTGELDTGSGSYKVGKTLTVLYDPNDPAIVHAGGGSGTLLGLNARILRDGEEIARAESTSQYPHEEDAEQHKVAAKIPAQGFYRVWTREQNLDLLFVTLLAFARSGATDDAGGSRKALFNTLRK